MKIIINTKEKLMTAAGHHQGDDNHPLNNLFGRHISHPEHKQYVMSIL